MAIRISTVICILFIMIGSSYAQIDSLFDKAIQADSIGNYKHSIEIYTQILAIDPNYGGALINRGRAYVFLGDTTQGFIDLNNAVKYHPHEKFYWARGIAYWYINRPDSAEIDLESAIEINPLFSEAYYLLGNLKLANKEYLPALYYSEFADKYAMNEAMSAALKTKLIKTFGKDVVSNFSYDKIVQIVKSIPAVKKAEKRAMTKNNAGFTYVLKMQRDIPWLYIITVKEKEEMKWTFKMDATNLKILNLNCRKS